MSDKRDTLQTWLAQEDREYEENRLRIESQHKRNTQNAIRAAERIVALEAENARLKARVEAGEVLAGAGVALHERLRHVLNVLEGKETRILPGPDIVEARRVLQQSHLEHMHALDAYRATATEES